MLDLNPRNQINFFSLALLTSVKHLIVSPEDNYVPEIKACGSNWACLCMILHSTYSNDKSSVKIENILTPAFRCRIGLKRGCMLLQPFLVFISVTFQRET